MLRKLYFTAALLALGSTATQAQVSSASKAFSFDFGPIPTEMTDGTLYLTNLAGETIEIYDETLTRIKTRVRSSVVSRSEQFTVETEESSAPRTLVVTSTAGETMLKQPIAAGQTSVQVDASRLSPGVNIVNVSGDRENATSCKVIVK